MRKMPAYTRISDHDPLPEKNWTHLKGVYVNIHLIAINRADTTVNN